MPTPDAYRQKYEIAEAERARLSEALDGLEAKLRTIADTAADDQQHQIDALEQLLLNRTALVGIQRKGRTIRFTFTRKGEVHRIETYGTWDQPVDEWRKVLLE